MARPSSFTEELGAQILDRISCGESLVRICEDDAMPHRATVMRWINKDPAFRDKYRASAQERLHSYAEELIEIADDQGLDPQQAKLMIYARQWVMGRLEPKKWGDKVSTEVSGPNGGPVETKDVTDRDRAKALASLFARLKAKGEA